MEFLVSGEISGLDQLLIDYVDMELKQEKNSIERFSRDEAVSKAAKDDLLKQRDVIVKMASSLLKRPDVSFELSQLESIRCKRVGDLGGYKAIKECSQAGVISQEIKAAILLAVRGRVHSHERSLSEKRSRGRTQ
jgi:hypothetical protein